MSAPISRHLNCQRCRGSTVVCVAVSTDKDLMGNLWGWYRCEAGHDIQVPLTAELYDALKAAVGPEKHEPRGNEGLA